jgi:LCP family protein required for cell wall assembly
MKDIQKNSQRYSETNQEYTRKEEYPGPHGGDSNKHGGYVDIYSSGKKKKRRISAAKVISFIFFTIIGAIGGLMLYAYHTLNSFNYDDLGSTDSNTTAKDDSNDDLLNDKMILNIMLIGSDSMSVGDHGRSDSLLILSLDIRHKKIKVTSLMRDTWVNIPGYGNDRLNAAYAYGGAKLTIETIQKNFGIYIDRYAIVDFDGFSNIIDTLGGIDLELTSSECTYINTYSGDKHTLKGAGLKHLTGLQALHYSRDRNSIGSDYDRTSRQRNVIRAVIDKLRTANVAQIAEITPGIAQILKQGTNIKPQEMSRLAVNSPTYLHFPLEEFRIPTDDNVSNKTIDQKMVLVINDMAKARSDLSKFIYEKSIDTPTAKTSENAASAQASKKQSTTSNNVTAQTREKQATVKKPAAKKSKKVAVH